MNTRFVSIAAALVLLSFSYARAAIFYWDPNGASVPGSTGTWDTTSAQWATSSTLSGSPVVWNTGNLAAFTAGSQTTAAIAITVNSPINTGGVFNGGLTGIAGVTALTFSTSGGGSLGFTGLQGFSTASGKTTTFSLPLTDAPSQPAGQLEPEGAGQLFLNGANTYSGGTLLAQTTLVNFNNAASFGTGPITLATGGSGDALVCEGTSAITIPNDFVANVAFNINLVGNTAGITYSGNWNLGANTVNLGSGGAVANVNILSGVISGSGAFGRQAQTTAGIIKLTGANTYTGKSSIQSGITSVSSINSVTTPAQQSSSSLGVPSSAANGTISIGSTTLPGTLIYTGIGETTDRVIDLAGTTGGGTIQNDGTGALTFTSAFTASGAGAKTLTLQGSYTGSANTISAAIVNSSSATSLTKAGAGSWTLTGVNTYSGATAISGGTLTIGGSGQLNSGSYGGVISGAGTFTYNSSANQILSGGNTLSGIFNLNSGAIGVGNSAVFGGAAVTVNINGGKLGNTAATGRTVPNGTTLNINADFTVDDSFFTTAANGQILFNGGTATLRNGNRTINVNQPNGQTVNLGIANVIGQDVPGRGIIKTGSGILALTGLNTYSGDTSISGGQININGTSTLGDATGTLHLSGGALNTTATRTASTAPLSNPIDVTADSSITTSSTAATVDLNISSSTVGGGAGTLTFKSTSTGGFKPRFSGSGFNFPRPIVLDNGSGSTLLQSFNATGTDQTFSGVISGSGSFNRTASSAGTGGRTIFTAANTYSGVTTVNDGVLLVNNTTGSGTGSGAVTVNANGTLGGTGAISGATTVNGTLSPGASIGTLTFNSSLSLLGTNMMEIDRGATPNADKIVMSSGTVTLGGNLTVVNLGGTPAQGDAFDLIDGTIAGGFASLTLPALPGGLAWDTSQLAPGGNGTITVVAALGSSLALVSSQNPSVVSSNVTFTATVSSTNGTPTGDVVFLTNGVPLSTNALSGGAASTSTSLLPLGTNVIIAQYAAQGIYLGSTDTFNQVVNTGSVLSTTNIILSISNNAGGTFTLNMLGTPQAQYYLQSATDLTPPPFWTAIVGSTNTADSNGLWSSVVSNAAPAYYRSTAINPAP